MVSAGNDRGGRAEACLWEHGGQHAAATSDGKEVNNGTTDELWEFNDRNTATAARGQADADRRQKLDAAMWRTLDPDPEISAKASAEVKELRSWQYGKPPEIALWRSPRRDVFLASGVLCVLAKGLGGRFSGGQRKILGDMFAAALDPRAPLTLDQVGERTLSLLGAAAG